MSLKGSKVVSWSYFLGNSGGGGILVGEDDGFLW